MDFCADVGTAGGYGEKIHLAATNACQRTRIARPFAWRSQSCIPLPQLICLSSVPKRCGADRNSKSDPTLRGLAGNEARFLALTYGLFCRRDNSRSLYPIDSTSRIKMAHVLHFHQPSIAQPTTQARFVVSRGRVQVSWPANAHSVWESYLESLSEP